MENYFRVLHSAILRHKSKGICHSTIPESPKMEFCWASLSPTVPVGEGEADTFPRSLSVV